jgi:hypothetical protein
MTTWPKVIATNGQARNMARERQRRPTSVTSSTPLCHAMRAMPEASAGAAISSPMADAGAAQA